MKNLFVCLLAGICLYACQPSASKEGKPLKNNNGTVIKAAAPVSANRTEVRKEPVTEYTTKVKDELNELYFKVKLYETPKTFTYLVKVEYEELRNTDTLVLPDFGIPPTVVVKAGPSTYSCIIGFLDKEGLFREYKLVEAKEDRLKISTLKHYTAHTYLVK